MKKSRVPVLIRIPPGLKAKLTELAKRERRSLNQQVEFLLDRAVQEQRRTEREDSRIHKQSQD